MKLRRIGFVAAVAGLALIRVASADVFSLPAGEKSLTFQTIGSPNNAADPSTGFGSVSYQYGLGTYDVTASQYVAMLNAVASVQDSFHLFNKGMSNGGNVGIIQSGTAGNFSYSVESGHENFPVDDVTWGDAARFCNWLQNGQPTGNEGVGTTESGSYQLSGAMTDQALATATRSPNATFVLPTENEWYKGAYESPATGGYFLFPTQSDTPPTNVLGPAPNNANFFVPNLGGSDATTGVSPVGAFSGTTSSYGLYDAGGNVFQWTDMAKGNQFALLGGSYNGGVSYLEAGQQVYSPPSSVDVNGFRIAEVPEPTSIAILGLTSVALLGRTPRKKFRT
jgi:sulfatase modifying factor 1